MLLEQELDDIRCFCYHDLLAWGQQMLHSTVDNARLEAEVLLSFCSAKSAVRIIADAQDLATPNHCRSFHKLIQRRLNGEPIAYLTGEREFWSLSLMVTPDVLIPRAETELLIEQVMVHIASMLGPKILDLGTGSGAIAIAIACNRGDAQLTATDKSLAALAVANTNAAQHDVSHIKFIHSDWYQSIAAVSCAPFDLIVSNPPYIAESDPHLTQGDLQFEPNVALVAADHGLHDLNVIIDGAGDFLKVGGWLMLEHGHQQGSAVRAMLHKHKFMLIDTLADYSALERVSVGQWLGQ